jgi:hypothetical protein
MSPFGRGQNKGKPDAAMVAGRARILGLRMVHAMAWPPPDLLEGIMAGWPDADRKKFTADYAAKAKELRSGLESAGAWAQASPKERAFFTAGLMDRTQQQLIDSSWGIESVGCCLWALGKLEALPPYDTEVAPGVASLMPEPGEKLSLRAEAELEKARSAAELWHWRSRTRQLVESGFEFPPLPDGMTMDDVIRMASETAHGQGDAGEPIKGDFPILGKAYRDLTAEEYSLATSIASERHKALNWICGLAPGNDWDRTPTDT